MKTTIEISNGVKTYKITPVGEDIFFEDECRVATTMPEAELFAIIDEYFQEQL